MNLLMPDGTRHKIGERITDVDHLIPTKENHVSTTIEDLKVLPASEAVAAAQAAHMAGDLTDQQIDEFLQYAGAQYAAPGPDATSKEKMGFFLRFRRAGRQVADGARNAARVGTGSLQGFLRSVKEAGLVGGAGLVLKGLGRVINEWIGWVNVANLLMATATGRRILKTVARPFVWLARKAVALLRKSDWASTKIDGYSNHAADKFERVDAAFNVRKHAEIGSWMMFRYRLGAVTGISMKVASKVSKAAPRMAKVSPWIAAGLFIATDRTSQAFFKSTWSKLRSVRVVVETTTEVFIKGEPTVTSTKVVPAGLSRAVRRAEAKAADKASAAAAKAQEAAEATYLVSGACSA